MIISASYKTDIPTFYGEWFMERLQAGYCKVVNPFSKHISTISLKRDDVSGFVFWTKNIGPFLKHLGEIHRLCYPFVVQHTINGYPRTLEHSVVDSAKSIDNLRRIAEVYGPRVGVWRYDTIVISSLTPSEFHLDTFSKLAKELEGVTDEVVISFAHIYRKTRRNMDEAAQEHGFEWSDPSVSWKQEVLSELVEIAFSHHIRATLCSQPQFLVAGCAEAHCIDADRLAAVAGSSIQAREKGNRPECRCSASRDIGEYDTCPHGCVYCYAVQNRQIALHRYRDHDPTSEFLFVPPAGAVDEGTKRERQHTLFEERTD